MRRRITSAALVLIAAIVASVLGVRFYLTRDAENRLSSGEDVSIAALRGPLPSNAAIACPDGYCGASGALPSPVFDVSATRLYEAWKQTLARQPRVRILADDHGRRVVALQRSALFQFPDVVFAEFVALGPERSSLAVYSRARYGRLDFGVNRARIETWLQSLQNNLAPASPAQ